nr:zinc finger BED domain-containing protein RICESLEEPER 2-like [Ipomoea batatas]
MSFSSLFSTYQWSPVGTAVEPSIGDHLLGVSVEEDMLFEFFRVSSPKYSTICACVDSKRMQMFWRDSKTKTDCEIYLMCHIETYVSQRVSKWECDLVKGETAKLHKLIKASLREEASNFKVQWT